MTSAQDGLPADRRALAVVVVAIGTIMATIDGLIANTALPTIARELHATASQTIWVVNGFQLAVVMTLLTTANLGDVRGQSWVYRYGLVLFTIGSLMCALSRTLPLLVAARVVQGIGAAGLMAVGPALYRQIFPAAQLGRALGLSAVIVATSSAAGPTVGGTILAFLPWPWLFAVNVPLGIVAGFLGRRALPPDRGTHNRIDIPSGILSAIGFGAIVFSVDGFRRGDPRVLIAAEFALGVVAFAVFAARQRRIPNPLLAVELFKIPTFALASVTSTFTYIAQGLAYVSLPFYFQSVLGRTPFESGLLLTSWPLATAIVAPIAGRLSDRYPAGVLSTIGLAVMSTGFALYASLNEHAAPLVIALHGVVCGIGFGFFQSPNNRELMGSAPRRQMGSAAGVLASVRLLGQTLGAALVAVVFDIAAAALAGSHDIGHVVRVGTPIALWTGCGCTAFATVLSGLRNFTASQPAESPSRS